MSGVSRQITVAIVGGGFSGAAVAYHLALCGLPIRIAVFEPRSALGAGLAYSGRDPQHRINVPAQKMSLIPSDEAHFRRWIDETNATAGDSEAASHEGDLYPSRRVFGSYVEQQLRPLLARGAIEHIQEPVTAVTRQGEAWLVRGQNINVSTDILVIATTHPPPRVPGVIAKALGDDERLIADATAAGALSKIDAGAKVLIVGTGLTMADVIATLDAQGHTGKIMAISRRGLRSRGQAIKAADPFGTFNDPLPKTALELLRRVRASIAEAERQGVTWHAVLDCVRAQARTFWPALPILERQRIVRHLRAHWDVHRFRIAPQPEAIIDRRIAEGSLSIVAAGVEQVLSSPSRLDVALRLRRTRERVVETFDYIITTTGPAHSEILSSQPYLAGLKAAGHVVEDPTHLGIACDKAARALSSCGAPDNRLFIAGPLARGTIGELMGVPEVSEFCAVLAGEVADEATRLGGAPDKLSESLDLQPLSISR